MEKLQFLQLCSQSMQTIWRKVALNNLISSSGIDNVDGVKEPMPRGRTRFFGKSKLHQIMQYSINALKDDVNFDIPSNVPISMPYAQQLSNMVNHNKLLVTTEEQN